VGVSGGNGDAAAAVSSLKAAIGGGEDSVEAAVVFDFGVPLPLLSHESQYNSSLD
jgi:hypothetical protein